MSLSYKNINGQDLFIAQLESCEVRFKLKAEGLPAEVLSAQAEIQSDISELEVLKGHELEVYVDNLAVKYSPSTYFMGEKTSGYDFQKFLLNTVDVKVNQDLNSCFAKILVGQNHDLNEYLLEDKTLFCIQNIKQHEPSMFRVGFIKTLMVSDNLKEVLNKIGVTATLLIEKVVSEHCNYKTQKLLFDQTKLSCPEVKKPKRISFKILV